MMELLAIFVVWMFPGFIMGVIEAWNKKIHLAILLIFSVWIISALIIVEEPIKAITVAGTLTEFIAVVAGYLVGRISGGEMYKEAFET